jgi:hydroxymethylpyrimidine pyrophosphatase-like HAD family hydrolase
MHYLALASDYDGTLSEDGKVSERTRQALERVKASGRKLLLVTGRFLEDLQQVFPQFDLFDYIVAENGAVLYNPASSSERLLGEPPDPRFLQVLHDQGVPITSGRVIAATWHPYETPVIESIQKLNLKLQVIFNKGAVMVLPTSIDKSVGLLAALSDLHISAQNVVGFGDAENDYTFLSQCGFSIAVANALPSLKEQVDYTTRASRGEGVVEGIEMLLSNDLAGIHQHRKRG